MKTVVGLSENSSECQLDVLYEDGNVGSNCVGRPSGEVSNISNTGSRSFVTIKHEDGVRRRYTYDLKTLSIIFQTNV